MTQLTSGEHRHHPSLFGPIVLIAIGVYFLLTRMNLVSELYWWDVLGLWPLLLIFLGLNILALQVPRPLGTLLSGLVALLAVAVFGYILLFGLDNTPLRRIGRIGSGAWQTEPIALAMDGVQTADVDIEIGPPGANLYALEDSRNLIEGQVTYTDDLLFETSTSAGRASVRVEPRNRAERWFFLPGRWRNVDEAERWQLGLNPNVETALSLNASAGSSRLDLRGLTLSDLVVDANAGQVALFLPNGDYDAALAVNGASADITLPESGRHSIELAVNAGAAQLHLPAGMAARVEVDGALSNFNADNARLRRVSGETSNGVWETIGSASAQDRVDLIIHIAVGSVTIRTP
ncbi:MAG TPA: DUF5668 domain-containing protein [Anaerolineae bacterium]